MASLTGLAGRRVLVAGAGVTGKSVASALAAMDARVTVTDGNADRLAELPELPGVELVPGLSAPPEGTSLVVTSPGWRPTAPLLVAAAEAGIEVIGDVELAWRIGQESGDPPVWLAITGTDGKTTTVAMLESILRAAGEDAVACGNVGLAVLDAVAAGHRTLAVELSSYQLHWSNTLAPEAAVVLNLASDHLDWHGSMAEYAAAKGKIYRQAGTVVYNADDKWSATLAREQGRPGATTAGFLAGVPEDGQLGVANGQLVDRAFGAGPFFDVAGVRPPGPHNVANALAAAALARAHGVSADAIATGLRDFQPVAHRAEPVGEFDGVRYVNDSKATNTHAAAGSLLAYPNVVWIAGGQLKGDPVDELVAAAAGRLRGVVLIGEGADVIAAAVARHAPDIPVNRVAIRDDRAMTAAVNAATAMAREGDVVLLAPAAASFDMFRDYVQRGEAFTHAVRELGQAGRHHGGG